MKAKAVARAIPLNADERRVTSVAYQAHQVKPVYSTDYIESGVAGLFL